MNEFIRLIETISQAGAPRNNNCVRLPVSWTTYYMPSEVNKILKSVLFIILQVRRVEVSKV